MKKIVSLLVFLSILISSTSINAQEIPTDETSQEAFVIPVPQEEIDREEQLQLKQQNNKARTPLYEYKNELAGTQTAKKVKIGYAAGQPPKGTIFHSPGSFYWSEGGSKVTVTITVAYGAYSLGVTPGTISGTGVVVKSPYKGQAVKLLIHKDIKVKKYKQYRKAVMGSGTWEYVGDVYTKVPVLNHYTVVKV
ncbi:hypothetical protein AN960_20310 [Bacillus sp. FJAT-25509]|uniref:hypothetical protein n=1 Tax=Bacillus sp. FJAT-25509 TaxID=1712029 RepID=UPI0006F792EF|nr:hypothetical protein [Bacillus sp. FJAT-25509]KQL33984.1 hypothetical protein AN960_20310 [Bacillus sp. FJAT-25509]